MALYLGESEKLNIYINGIRYKLNLGISEIIEERNVLLSSDNFILLDSNGLYLVAKESE